MKRKSMFLTHLRGAMLLLLASILFVNTSRSQQWTITSCNTTGTTTYGPMYSTSTANAVSRHAVIYPAAMLTGIGGRLLSSVYFNRTTASGAMAGTPNFKVYLKEVTNSDWGTADLTWATEITGATLVYDNNPASIVGTTAGWKAFPFTTNFYYTGDKNLAVFLEYKNATASTSISWNYELNAPCASLVDNMKYNTATTGTLAATLTSSINRHPIIGFNYAALPGCTGTPVAGTAKSSTAIACSGNSVTFSLTGNNFATGQTYQWQSSNSISGPWTNVGTAQPFPTLTTTVSSTAYYRCVVTCGAGTNNSTSTMVTVPTAQMAFGNFTINSAVPTGGLNFQTFTDAINAAKCGISGPTIFNVVAGSGPYNEQITIPAIPNSSASNTLTILGNGAQLIFNSSNSAERAGIKLDGADYVTISNLKIKSTGLVGYGVQMLNNADNNTITGCTIENSTESTGDEFAGIVISGSATDPFATGSDCDNITINNNTISGGTYGITAFGNGTTTRLNNVKITNNVIKDFYNYAMDLEGHANLLVENNDISRPTRTTLSTFYGTYLTDVINGKISKNKYHNNSDAAPTGTSATYAIYLSSADGTAANPNIFSNNLVYNINGNGTSYALYNSSSDYALYYHNTISYDNAASTSGATRGFYQTGAATGIEIKNNIFSITRGGTGAKYMFYKATAANVIAIDYNVYYFNAPAGTNNFGFSGTDQATYSAWKTTSGQDANSVEGNNPNFTSATTGNLLPTNYTVDNAGTPLTAVTTDFAGITRSTIKPDAGAYEFTVCNAPSSLAANTITSSGANLSWASFGNAIGYEYAVTSSATPPGSGTSTTSTTYNPTTLAPGTVYYLHVRSKCTATSYSPWGTISFTTACPAPTSLSITGVTYSSANINWSAISGVVNYEIAITTSSTPPASGSTVHVASYSPNTLNAGTTYYVHLRTKCVAGTFSSWTTATFATPTCNAPATPVISNITASSADANWNTVSGAIAYEYAITTSSTPPATGNYTTSTTRNFPTLNYNTTYYVHVRSQCSAANYSAWSTTNFTTATPPCSTPVISVSAVTSSTANINWLTATGASAYEYAITTSATPPASGTSTPLTYTTAGTGLSSGTTYYVHVRSVCLPTLSSSWATVSFTTLCAEVSHFTFSNINYTSVDINWLAKAGIVDYEYVLSSSPVSPASGTVISTTTYSPSGLTAGETYYFHLRSRCANSTYSAWVVKPFSTKACDAALNPKANNVTYTTADISWNVLTAALGYEYIISHDPNPPATGTATTNTNFSLANLDPNSTYYIHVRTKCGPTTYSPWVLGSFATQTCTLSIPTAQSTSYTSALITWPKNPIALSYEYVVNQSSTPPATGFVTTDTNYTAINLTTGATYYVHLRSKCATGIYSDWNTQTFEVKGCQKPENLTISSITPTTAYITWKSSNTALNYEYAVTLNGVAPTNTIEGYYPIANLKDLNANTTYNFHTRAVCNSIYKSDWTVLAFKTSDYPTNVANVKNELGIEAYPNPAHNTITLKLNSLIKPSGQILLTDMAGRILKTDEVKSSETTIDMSQLVPGMYMLKYSNENTHYTMKITKQ